nr:MAG TPA_asm: hypothetical protein [Caudoviricetes sp.]
MLSLYILHKKAYNVIVIFVSFSDIEIISR